MAHHAHAHITEVNAPHLSMIADPGIVAQVILQAVRATADGPIAARGIAYRSLTGPCKRYR